MSKILSYNNKTTKTAGTDWIAVDPYSDDDIARIKDPNGGLSRNPRTAIPSPFAQIDLVKNAFLHVTPTPQGATGVMSERIMVSNALDVAQLFFEIENHRSLLRIVRWNRQQGLAALRANPSQALYGETLELFLNADPGYNFEAMTDWYILLADGHAVGGTSPASFTMAVPDAQPMPHIAVEPNVQLFASIRDLWERDQEFVYHLFLLFNAYPELRRRLGSVYGYMTRNLDMIRSRRPELYRRITAVLSNPLALQEGLAPDVRQRLDQDFEPLTGESAVSLFGAPLYCKRRQDIRHMAQSSDFVIAPTREQPAGEPLPLVLRGGFDGSIDHYSYLGSEWDSSTQVWAQGVPLESRVLPASAVTYPFVTTADLFTPNIIKLSASIDTSHFFDGNLTHAIIGAKSSYLLPLTPLFFKYFNASDLQGTVCGRHMIDMAEGSDGRVTVTLRVPVAKRFIELSRTYAPNADPSWQWDEQLGTGRVVPDVQLDVSIFPMVRTPHSNDYTAQLFSWIPQGSASLRFLGDGMAEKATREKTRTSSGAETPYATTYYKVATSFDLIEAMVTTPLGQFTSMIVPCWQPYTPSNRELIFAVDFGTTNSHVEWAERGQESQPLNFEHTAGQTLVGSLMQNGSVMIADLLQNVEFVPASINEVYGFPLRSALASNRNGDGSADLFSSVNIPFLYERQYFSGYDVTTNLKWRGDTSLSQEFLRELVLLIRAKTLIENADPARVHLVYFYPVSMGSGDRMKLSRAWEDLYNAYLGGDAATNLHAYPESIAPAYYYKSADVTGSSYVSIDIGGGTSDTVVYQASSDARRTLPAAISSFRFAGDAIFGDAFDDRNADNNPLVQHYASYFKALVGRNADTKYLASILDDIMRGKRSEDINAFLFGIENVEQIRTLNAVDRKNYSYNSILQNDDQRRLVFMYFYAAMLYYIAQAMKHRNYVKPKQLYFSGTGSKIINILGPMSLVTQFTQMIFERVFGEQYTEPFTIKMELDSPKQVTCRGGIKLENQRLDMGGSPDVAELMAMLTPSRIKQLKYCYNMINDEPLSMPVMRQSTTRQAIVEQVARFNEFFTSLCDADVRDMFGIENRVFTIFRQVLGRDVTNYMNASIAAYLDGRYQDEDEIEDVPFFYPIIGIIRYNLLTNLTNEVINQ